MSVSIKWTESHKAQAAKNKEAGLSHPLLELDDIEYIYAELLKIKHDPMVNIQVESDSDSQSWVIIDLPTQKILEPLDHESPVVDSYEVESIILDLPEGALYPLKMS